MTSPTNSARSAVLSTKAASNSGAKFVLAVAICLVLCFSLSTRLIAQTGGEAGIQGTVVDSTGAAIPHASVTATNDATGSTTTRTTTDDGLFTMSPILPGTYTVRAKAQGFSESVQKNFTINALVMTALKMELKPGETSTEITVSEAPPQLETTNATLGLTIENTTYTNLPLIMNGSMRDPTAFATLTPGAQSGTRLPVIGGTGNYLGQLYLDGLPAETVSQQGDNRLVSQALDVDAVDQMQVVTSTPPAEYSGAGAENFSMKSGTLKYHGSVKDFIRNTDLDAYPFVKGTAKAVDHQNELSATFGGHVPGTKRIFFFVAYDKYHNRTEANASNFTIPTTLERAGDFTELNGGVGTGGLSGTGSNNPAFLYDPTTTSCVGSTCTRQPFMGTKNGVPTYNVIPSNYISPIAKSMEQFLPDPTTPTQLTNNYTSGLSKGFDNHAIDYRVDFQVNDRHRISAVGAWGSVNYLNNYSTPYLPQPYTGGDLANIYPKNFSVEDAYTLSNSLVNQLKFGFVRFFQNIHNSTQGVSKYTIGTMGVTNLPGGQAGEEFPGVSFATTTKFGTAQQTWTTNSNSASTQLTTPNNFALVDNLQWVKGKHAITGGISIQWQEINNANPTTFTGILSLPTTAFSTANFIGSSLSTTATGYSYASYLLGAIGGTPSIGLQPVSELGGRYRPIAPYLEDTWKVTSKLTVNAGLRWDYLPPFHEVKDRWSFLNPNITNTASGNLGALQFAGSYGGAGVSCGCRTPVQTYWKNWGPRVGITYAFDQKTVLRVGIGRVFSQGGGVGGRGGATGGTGQLGFNTTATGPAEVTTGAGAGPSFYLNNSTYFQGLGIANTDLFGKGYTYPSAPALGPASQILNTGNYLNTSNAYVTASSVSYADPYFSGRAPDFNFYNLGVERAITNNMTLAINYVGNQSHHIENSTNTGVGTARGYWSNQLNPIYLAGLGGLKDSTGNNPLLTSAATAANVAIAKAAMPGINIPASFQAAAAVKTTATIAQGLTAFPQYSSVGDTWGQNVGNFSYNSLQITLERRFAHGLQFNLNYTWAKNIGDDGPFRTGFDLPAASVSGGARSWHMNRIDRGLTTFDSPHNIHAFGVYQLPFGKGHLGGGHFITDALLSGWQLSGIYTYSTGMPVQITYSGCTTPLQGQCMPDAAAGFSGPARIHGKPGTGPGTGRLASNLKTVQYIDVNAFAKPANISPSGVAVLNLIGNAPRTGAYGLRNPSQMNVDFGLRRTIPLYDRLAFTFEANAFNAFNHPLFSGPSGAWSAGSTSFGTISSASNQPRQFELAGHITF